MAGKRKIGAIIALDGEKEFRQSVTNCNKSLTTMKSEMALVKAEFDGQANSLEALQKKHSVLSRILEEQTRKQEEVEKGLQHARESYSKVGKGLDELKGKYSEAKESLENMRSVSSSTDTELKEQEQAVKELSEAIAKGEKNYQTASNRVKDWEAKLNTAKAQTIKANGELNKNAAYMKEAEDATDKCATSIDAFGKETKKAEELVVDFGGAVKLNIADTVVDAAKDMITGVAEQVTGLEEASARMQASTGASTETMAGYKSVLEDIYKGNYGDSFEDIAAASEQVVQTMKDISPESLQNVTEKAITLRDTFDMDVNESIRAVDVMMTTMGMDADEAFDLIAKGAQNGLNRSGELTDNLTEYGQLWHQAGFSAEEMFAILENGLDSGAYNLDKVNDFVKEFTVSLADGRIEENIGNFSTETQDLFGKWKEGKATSRDVFYSVISDIKNATSEQEALTLASDTWSALGEDNALAVISSLGDVNDAYKDVRGTMKEIQEVRYDTLINKYEQLGRKVQTELITPVAENFLPLAESGIELLTENMDLLIPVIGGVAAGFAAFKAATAISDAVEAVSALQSATEGAATAQQIFNAVTNMNPYVLLAAGAAAAVAAVALYVGNTEKAKSETDLLLESSQKTNEEMQELVDKMQESSGNWEDTASNFDAQEQAAGNLVDQLYELESASDKTGQTKSRMKVIVSELNTMFPELALAIDEETGKVNKNKEAVEASIEASAAYRKAKAAEKRLTEISEELVDAEIKRAEAEDNIKSIEEELNTLEKDRRESLENVSDGMVEYNGTVMDLNTAILQMSNREFELTEARKDAQKSLEELDGACDVLNSSYTNLEEYEQEQIDLSGQVSEAYAETGGAATQAAADVEASAASQQSSSAAISETTISIAEAYSNMKQTVTESIQAQMDMFTEFSGTIYDNEEDIDNATKSLLENMQSQIDGVSLWADQMNQLSSRGVDDGILQKLAEMGPEGVEYVQAFANMSDDELKRANEMWKTSIDMKEGVNEKVSGMLETYTTTLAGGEEQVTQAWTEMGVNSWEGFSQAISEKEEEAKKLGLSFGETFIEGGAEGLGVQSPSWKTKEQGMYVVEGLTEGINENKEKAVEAVRTMGEEIIAENEKALNGTKFSKMGRDSVSGIISGIRSQEKTATAKMRQLINEIANIAKKGTSGSSYSAFGKTAVTGLVSGISDTQRTAVSRMQGLIDEMENVTRNGTRSSSYAVFGRNAVTGIGSGIAAAGGQPVAQMRNVTNQIAAVGYSIPSLYNAGVNVSYGLANGIAAGRSAAVNAVANMCQSVINQARSSLRINSPSKVFEDIGGYTAEGFQVGYMDKIGNVNRMIASTMDYSDMSPKMPAFGNPGNSGGVLDALLEYLPYLKTIAEKKYMAYVSADQAVPVLEGGISNSMSLAAARRRK